MSITISPHGNCGGVQRRADGSYVWWWSEMCASHIRTRTEEDFQGVPAEALRAIADDMDRIAREARTHA